MFDDLQRHERAQIEKYLSSVASDMRKSGSSENQIKTVRGALAEQIFEAVREAGDGAVLDSILNSIDPPTAFRESDSKDRGVEMILGRLSLITALGVAAIAFIIFPALGTPEDAGGGLFIFGELIALCLGIFSRRTQTGKVGLICSAACLVVFLIIVFTLGDGG